MPQTGLASPEWRTGIILHALTHLCLAVLAAEWITACWYLYECAADSLHTLRTAITGLKLSCFMQHGASRWPQPLVLRLQKRGVVDFTRRRRWLRRCRQDLTRPSPPPQEPPASSPRQSPVVPAARRTTSIRHVLMPPTSLMLCFHIADLRSYCLALDRVQGIACRYVGFVFVKQLHCC